MPTDERLGTDDRDGLQDRRKPSIQLDEEQAIVVREPDATVQLTPQHRQLMSDSRVLASSRLCDLNGEAKMARMNTTSAIIVR